MSTALPFLNNTFREIFLREPHSIAISQNPGNRYFIEQLSSQCQPAMEVGRGNAHNGVESPYNVYTRINLLSVLL